MSSLTYFNPSTDETTTPETTINQANNAETEVQYSTYRSHNDNVPKRVSGTLKGFVKTFSHHPIRHEKGGLAFSPAIFKEGATRKNQNVVAVTMLVLDIDDGTPYEQLQDKLTGFWHLVYSTHSHSPQRHKYRVVILLDKPIANADWPAFWDRANAYFGGHLDPATKDTARLYYMPSHANGAEHFSEFHDGRPLSPDDLPEVAIPVAIRSQAGSAIKDQRLPPSRMAELGIEEAHDPHPAEALPVMVERCAFMQHASAPENQPNVSEPLWRAMISNAAMAEDSDAWIHVASETHPDYTEPETDRKINTSRAHGAPLTCENIRANGFDGCPAGGCLSVKGVPVKAPAALMRWYGRSAQATATAEDRLSKERYEVGSFNVSKDGILHTEWKQDKNGKEYPQATWVSRTRIDLKYQIRDASSGNWSLVLLITDPDGQQKEYTLSQADLHTPSKSYRQEIARLGGVLCTSGKASELFAEYLLEASMDIAKATLVTRIGWQSNGVFALPSGVYGDADQGQYHFRLNNKQMATSFESLGSLDGWNDAMALLHGNSRLQLFVVTALAGCVLELLGVENYGFNLVGPSSIGKSTALRAAESVWRQCQVLLNWNGTSNGIQSLAALHNNTVMALDEMGMSEAHALFTLMYFLANGRERVRAQQSGEHRETKTFSLSYLSTSERSANQLLEAGGKEGAAGQAIRMLEIPAEVKLGIFEQLNGCQNSAELANRINAGVKANSGHAGRAWVTLLADPERQPLLLQRIRECQAQFVDSCKRDGDAGQTQRALEKFALTAGVGVVCCEEGILPWDTQDVLQGIQRCFDAWLGQRGSRGELEAQQAIDAANRFIMLHGASRFEHRYVSGVEDSRSHINNRAGFVEVTDDGLVYYVNAEVYKRELCGSLDPKTVTKCLREAGFLIDGKDGAQHRSRDNGQRVSFYAIKGSIIGDHRPATLDPAPSQVSELAANYQV